MTEEVQRVVQGVLEAGDVEGVLALWEGDGGVGPHLYRPGDDLGGLVLSPKYSMALVVRWIHQHSRGTRLGVVLRGCEERALVELAKRGQVEMSLVDVIGVGCSEEEARECGCISPRPSRVMIGEAAGPAEAHRPLVDLPPAEDGERLGYWREQYRKCIKCYGCRNVCPVCACSECMMTEHDWVAGGEIPPTFATFHLIKAYHMADRCVECRECEAACPVSIPLAELYGRLVRDVERRYGYVTGADVEERPPLLTALMDEPILDKEGD